MKKITEIYKEYKTIPNLAMHQMRVAAVAMQICDSMDLDIDKDSIITICLLHDMGNIIKFNLDNNLKLIEDSDIGYWKGVQKEYIDKYGESEHVASALIAKEVGVSQYVFLMIGKMISSHIKEIAEEYDLVRKICIYSDNRVSPYGVVSAEEHSLNAKERYKNHKHAFDEESRKFFMNYLYSIESQIFSHTKIQPEDITDASVAPYLEKIKNFQI